MPQNNWWSCDGRGGAWANRARLSRRQVLTRTLSAAALAAWAGRRSALAQVSTSAHHKETGNVLITLFLRGAADGLSLIPPHGDDEYYRARPTISLSASKSSAEKDRVLDLDGFFGLHPSLSALFPFYQDGKLAVVHAVGSGDQTRSHFEAMTTMERGLAGDDNAGTASGWLARYLNATPVRDPSPLRAVAWGTILPDILRGAPDVSTLASLDDFRLQTSEPKSKPRMEQALKLLYRQGDDAIARAGRETLAALNTLSRVDPKSYHPADSAVYPQSELGEGLRQVACLIKADVGLETACLDRSGWDTHVAQGGAVGFLALQFQDVGDSLAAFARDLGATYSKQVTTVVMTEFGRRVGENSGLGTDHGRGSALLVLGGNVSGGKLYSKWPGLRPDQLEPPGDLRVTTDYRDVLAEVIARHAGSSASLAQVFPNYSARFLGIMHPSA